jgi:hypothetical protein
MMQHASGVYLSLPASLCARWLSGANASLTNRMLLYVSMPCTAYHTFGACQHWLVLRNTGALHSTACYCCQHRLAGSAWLSGAKASMKNGMLLYMSMPCTNGQRKRSTLGKSSKPSYTSTAANNPSIAT